MAKKLDTDDQGALIAHITGPKPNTREILEAYQRHPATKNPAELLKCPKCEAPIPPNVPTRSGVIYDCYECNTQVTGDEMLDQAKAIALG